MATDCLRGCIGDFAKDSPIKKPLDTHVLLPWVEMWICDKDDKKLAVANTSSKQNNAVIKSFQFGLSDGVGANFEVVDEAGGNFSRFFTMLLTGTAEIKSKHSLRFRWGWARNDCGLGGRTYINDRGSNLFPTGPPTHMSRTHTLIISQIKGNFEGGLFSYVIEGTDVTLPLYASRDNKVFGEEGQQKEIPVEEAIRSYLKSYDIDVEFFQLDNNQKPTALRWKPQGNIRVQGGPNGVWKTLNRNPLQTVRDWLSLAVTEKDKGVVMFWQTSKENQNLQKPLLIVLRTNKPNCEKDFNPTMFSVGTYIVNGASCSPVLSFTPEFYWFLHQALNASGSIEQDATAGKQVREENGPHPCFQPQDKENLRPGTGMQVIQTEDPNLNTLFLTDANIIGSKNKMAHIKANMNANPITAEMRIQGDPNFDNPILAHGCYVNIVYINPFVVTSGSGGNCEWLAKPVCNEVFTNSSWRIQGVFHEIREGSYTTTIKLHLPAPGIDIRRGEGIGGNGVKMPSGCT